MIVTDILEISASKKKVYIDQEFAFVLYKGELRKYGIANGATLRPEIYREIMEEILPKRAKLRCMNLLKSKDYTTMQLQQKLEQGFYPKEIIAEALAYVSSYGYIDDERYAEDFIGYNHECKSKRRIDNDLLKKGVSKEVIVAAWHKWEQKGNSQNEEGQIERLLEKKHFDVVGADWKELQKIYGFLLRKGFDAGRIRKVLEKYNSEMYNLND